MLGKEDKPQPPEKLYKFRTLGYPRINQRPESPQVRTPAPVAARSPVCEARNLTRAGLSQKRPGAWGPLR